MIKGLKALKRVAGMVSTFQLGGNWGDGASRVQENADASEGLK